MVILPMVTENNDQQLWRLNVDTGELKQLSSGKLENSTSCTPDGKWVVYLATVPTDGLNHIFKLSTAGGTPIELVRGSVYNPSVSPDGSTVVYGKTEGQGTSAKAKIIVQKLEDGVPIHEIEMPATYNFFRLGWTPDGQAIAYVHNTTGNTQNVYVQPLAGGTPVQLTHFDSEPAVVPAYAWSRDGKKFAVTRARYNDTDVVMFSGFR